MSHHKKDNVVSQQPSVVIIKTIKKKKKEVKKETTLLNVVKNNARSRSRSRSPSPSPSPSPYETIYSNLDLAKIHSTFIERVGKKLPSSLSKEEIHQILKQINNPMEHIYDGCITTIYKPTKEKGYVQIKIDGKKYYLHVLAAIIRLGRHPNNDEEGSHLCHNPACCNFFHMWLEHGDINKSRLCCFLYLGKHESYVCPHDPPCKATYM